jgi:1-acyl-sn-glycerol-3-phosphate acyltransferase
MTISEIQKQLRETGCYATPVAACPPRPVFGAAWQYHTQVVRSLLGGLRDARHGRLDRAAWSILGHAALARAEQLGAKVRCDGFDVGGRCGTPVVYVANHMSMMETIVLPPLLLGYGPLAIVLKRSLMEYPLLGAVFRALDPIGVSRRNARADLRAVLDQGCAKLAAGASVLLFPQGTRSRVFIPEQFNTLGEKLSRDAGVPLVPIALQTDFAPCGRILRDFGPVDPQRPIRFSAGPAIPPGLPRGERHQMALAFITGRLREWGLPVADDARRSKNGEPEPKAES